jgi:hypothetical protein
MAKALFTTTFATDDLGLRRAVNVLIKNEEQFACVPDALHWMLSVTDKGKQILIDNGIEVY